MRDGARDDTRNGLRPRRGILRAPPRRNGRVLGGKQLGTARARRRCRERFEAGARRWPREGRRARSYLCTRRGRRDLVLGNGSVSSRRRRRGVHRARAGEASNPARHPRRRRQHGGLRSGRWWDPVLGREFVGAGGAASRDAVCGDTSTTTGRAASGRARSPDRGRLRDVRPARGRRDGHVGLQSFSRARLVAVPRSVSGADERAWRLDGRRRGPGRLRDCGRHGVLLGCSRSEIYRGAHPVPSHRPRASGARRRARARSPDRDDKHDSHARHRSWDHPTLSMVCNYALGSGVLRWIQRERSGR